MDDLEAKSPPPPNERASSPAVARTVCLLACVLAMLPILYVGSFAFLMANGQYNLGLIASIDPSTDQRISDALITFYWPLLKLWFAFAGSGE